MALSVLKMMLRCATPDEFLDELLKAVKNNAWHGEKTSATEVADIERKVEEIIAQEQKQPDVRLRYPALNFEAPDGTSMYFAVDLTVPGVRKPWRNAVEEPRGRLRLFTKLFVPLERGEWEAAKSVLGEKLFSHPVRGNWSNSPTVTRQLLLPFFAFQHWSSSMRFRERAAKGPNSVYSFPRIQVSKEKLDALQRYDTASRTVFDYLTTLEFLTEQYSPNIYAAKVRLPKSNSNCATSNSPLARFLDHYKQHHSFFLALADIAKKD
ncbi:MAG: hypothetical protein QW343_02510 [Candidatus Norongarragalinales archaeon]